MPFRGGLNTSPWTNFHPNSSWASSCNNILIRRAPRNRELAHTRRGSRFSCLIIGGGEGLLLKGSNFISIVNVPILQLPNGKPRREGGMTENADLLKLSYVWNEKQAFNRLSSNAVRFVDVMQTAVVKGKLCKTPANILFISVFYYPNHFKSEDAPVPYFPAFSPH